MAKRLDGQTAVITGAGQGIGRAIVHSFAREGSRVWATSRSLAPLKSLEKTTSVRIEQLDVTRPADVAAAAQKIGSVDILVNCAGYVASGTILECSSEELERTLDVNLMGAFYMTRAFLPAMCTRGVGSIINIASVLSSITSAPGRFAYSTAKAALIGFTKSVAVDFVNQGNPGQRRLPRCHPDAGTGITNCRQRRPQRHAGGFCRSTQDGAYRYGRGSFSGLSVSGIRRKQLRDRTDTGFGWWYDLVKTPDRDWNRSVGFRSKKHPLFRISSSPRHMLIDAMEQPCR
jgi:hypothetical protein